MALVLTRSVKMMVAAAVASGWLGAAVTQSPVAEQSSRAASDPLPPGLPAPMPRAEHLRERLSEPPLPSRGRNPFVFGARSTPRSTTSVRDRSEVPGEAPVEALPPMPVFKLSGIASNAESGATVLTAILNDNGAMVFAKAGDKLSSGYSVVRVDETSVTLVDAAGITQTIRLP